MKNQLQIPVFLLVTFISLPSYGCEPTVEQMEASARRDLAIEEMYVTEIYRRSDHVVIGVVVDVRDSEDPDYSQSAEIKVERVIKGKAIKHISALMHKVNDSKVTSDTEDEIMKISSCDIPYDPTSDEEPYTINGARALFYIEKGVLKRINFFPLEPVLMRFDVDKEIRFLTTKIKKN